MRLTSRDLALRTRLRRPRTWPTTRLRAVRQFLVQLDKNPSPFWALSKRRCSRPKWARARLTARTYTKTWP